MSSQAFRCTGLVVLLSALEAAPSDTQTFEAKTSVLVVELPVQVLASGRRHFTTHTCPPVCE